VPARVRVLNDVTLLFEVYATYLIRQEHQQVDSLSGAERR
jgi:hypothetical protein